MSAGEFTTALKNKALQEWLKNEKAAGGGASKIGRDAYSKANTNILVNNVELYRSAEETSAKTAFMITKDTVRDLIVQYHGVTDPVVLAE